MTMATQSLVQLVVVLFCSCAPARPVDDLSDLPLSLDSQSILASRPRGHGIVSRLLNGKRSQGGGGIHKTLHLEHGGVGQRAAGRAGRRAGVDVTGGTSITFIQNLADTNVNPCRDFYGYSCGGFTADNKTTFSSYGSSWIELTSRLAKEVYMIMFRGTCENADYGQAWLSRNVVSPYNESCDGVKSTSASLRHLNAALGGMYPKCMDASHLEYQSIPAATELIQGLMPNCPLSRGSLLTCRFSKEELSKAIVESRRSSGSDISLFRFSVELDNQNTSQRVLGLSGQGNLPSLLAQKPEIMSYLVPMVQNYSDLAWQKGFPRKLNASKTLNFYSELARSFYTSQVQVPPDDSKYRTVEEMAAACPVIDWQALLKALYPQSQHASIGKMQTTLQPAFMKLNELLPTLSESDLADLVALEILMELDSTMPKAMRDVVYKFQEEYLGSSVNRDRDCLEFVQEFGGWAFAKPYVEEHFSAESKVFVSELADDIRTAFKNSLSSLSWMDSATLAKASLKTDSMVLSVGYPDWLVSDESKLLRRYALANGTALADLHAPSWLQMHSVAEQIKFDHEFAQLLQPVDRTDWIRSPIELSPYYNRMYNKIVFPACFLQPPIFDLGLPSAYLYGSLGFIMGHELTHGFDWGGSQRDHLGSLVPRWFSGSAATAFNDGTSCFKKQYSAEVVYPTDGSSKDGQQVDGEKTLSENIADNGGLALAYAAYHARYGSVADKDSPFPSPSGYRTNAQLMFIGASQFWCSIKDFKDLEVQLMGEHAPDQTRGYLPFANFPMFASVWECPAGYRMNPESRCMIFTVPPHASSPDADDAFAGIMASSCATVFPLMFLLISLVLF